MTGRVVLVAGGAGGIGAATTRAFAARGDEVVFSDISVDRGAELAAVLRAEGWHATFEHADMTSEADVAQLVDTIVGRHGRLDVGANIVGNTADSDVPGILIHDQTLDQWQGTIDRSLTSVFLSMKYELRAMVEHGGGVIVNVASLAGMRVAPASTPAYSAAKAAVIHLTSCAAVAYARKNIRVNAVAPGITATENAARELPSLTEAALRRHAIQRTATPEDQAAAIVWLAGDESAMTTGHVLPVDGGWAVR